MNRTLGDLEESRATNSVLEQQLREAVADGEVKGLEISNLKEEIYRNSLQTKTLNIRINEKNAEMEQLRISYDTVRKSEKKLQAELEQQRTEICEHERAIAELRTENKRLLAANMVKHETNSLLRDQMTDISQNNFVVSKEEFDKFKDMERDLSTGHTRNQDLVKSVELHMDLLQRAETEANALKVKLENAEAQIADLKEDAQLVATTNSSSANTFAAMKKEVVKLRKENKLFAERIDTLLAKKREGAIEDEDGGMRTVTVTQSYATTTANQIRANQQSSEDRGEERKKLRVAEEANHALRNRISFLLEQMDQASKLSITWKEQKALLKAQIQSLHQANIDLRERLVNVQRNFMDKTLYEIDNPTFRRGAIKGSGVLEVSPGMQPGSSDRFDGGSETAEDVAERMLTHPSPGMQEREGGTRNLIESTFRLDVATPLPNTVEGFVERRMFDVLCAFTTGERDVLQLDAHAGSSRVSKKKSTLKVN
jgi:myosin heavy subunit